MWRSGVSLVTWFGLEDKGGKGPYQSGLFVHAKKLEHARAKPVRTAFRFPFVAYLGTHKVTVWGRNATSTKTLVAIQRRHGIHGGWRTVARIRTNRYGIFKANVHLEATTKDWLRATARGSGKSLAFSLNPPTVNVVLDFDGGGRFLCEMTDCEPEKVAIGQEVEMTFRRMFTADGIHNYFWKARPKRWEPGGSQWQARE